MIPMFENTMTIQTIQQQLTSSKILRLTPGEYSISEPITISQDQYLDMTGSTINATSNPAIILDGARATLIGGRIISAGAGPVVHIKSGFRWKIDSTRIDGSKSCIGIQVDSPIGSGISQETSYFGTIRDVEIGSCDIGILLTEQANGIHISNPLVIGPQTCCFRFRGAYGNQIVGGFSHGGGQAGPNVTILDLQGKSANNCIIGHVAETGGDSHAYTIARDAQNNQILSQFNCKGNLSENSTGNWIVRFGNKGNGK